MREISKYFQLRKLFSNGTAIWNVNIKNLHTNETTMPNLIRKILRAEEIINLKHIFLTKDLDNGFMIISMESNNFQNHNSYY